VLLVAVGGAIAATVKDNSIVKIMTQNMNSGTNLGFASAWGAPDGVDLTWAEIVASDIPGRAGLVAAEIAAERPDIVALQEVTLWRMGPTPETATEVLFDPLESLRAGLAARGTPYQAVAVNLLTDLALPGNNGAFLRYTDRDVMLVCADLGPRAFHRSEVQTRVFDARLNFQGLPILQGWVSAEVRMGNRDFRYVMTHLETAIEGIPEATEVQVAQTHELLHSLRNVTVPVVICGDFNSDAESGEHIDSTPSVALIEAAGYADCWKLVHPSGPDYDPGYTWPLFLEDQYPPPYFLPSTPFERIDLFFSKGLQATSANVVTASAPEGTTPPYGSDHKGVVATFQW
jgi:endonuclease/exonuclease/phosphatase family metal-dependent hydrolase